MKKIIILLLVVVIGLASYELYFKDKSFKISPKPPPANMANPASINCKNKGGSTVIQSLKSGAQYGLCQFPDDMACEEWALMRGECPIGGVKTTGFDTMGQKYCAWLGGKTLAAPDSTCNLPDGTTCPTDELFAGTCN